MPNYRKLSRKEQIVFIAKHTPLEKEDLETWTDEELKLETKEVILDLEIQGIL